MGNSFTHTPKMGNSITHTPKMGNSITHTPKMGNSITHTPKSKPNEIWEESSPREYNQAVHAVLTPPYLIVRQIQFLKTEKVLLNQRVASSDDITLDDKLYTE